MIVKTVATMLCKYMNDICQMDDIENETIRYGMELLLENILKLIILLFFGIFLGKGMETVIILSVFCGLRSQSGGMHAQTNLGCTACMVLMWGISLLGYLNYKISNMVLYGIYVFSLNIIFCRVPATRYIEYFTRNIIWKKKFYSVSLLTILIFISYLNINIRELIIYPIILEVVSLLPYNKIQKGGKVVEGEVCEKSAGEYN